MPVKGRGSKARYWHVRVRRPGEFQRKTFRTMPAVAGGSLLIVGRLKGRTSMTLQALRIPKAKFPSPAAALAHAKRLMSKRKRKRNYRWSPPATNPLVESAPGVRHWACDECGKPLERGHGTLCPRCVLQFMHERDVHAEHTREVELPGPGAAPAANPPDFPGYEDPEMPLIYPKTTRIEMNRGHGRFKGSPFYHNFSKTTPVAQHGLPAGAEVRLPSGRRFTLPSRGILLHGPKPLWGKFPV